jgi:hypothetical protein
MNYKSANQELLPQDDIGEVFRPLGWFRGGQFDSHANDHFLRQRTNHRCLMRRGII